MEPPLFVYLDFLFFYLGLLTVMCNVLLTLHCVPLQVFLPPLSPGVHSGVFFFSSFFFLSKFQVFAFLIPCQFVVFQSVD